MMVKLQILITSILILRQGRKKPFSRREGLFKVFRGCATCYHFNGFGTGESPKSATCIAQSRNADHATPTANHLTRNPQPDAIAPAMNPSTGICQE